MAYDFNWDLKTVAPEINGFVQGLLSQKTEDKPTQPLRGLFSNSNEAADEEYDPQPTAVLGEKTKYIGNTAPTYTVEDTKKAWAKEPLEKKINFMNHLLKDAYFGGVSEENSSFLHFYKDYLTPEEQKQIVLLEGTPPSYAEKYESPEQSQPESSSDDDAHLPHGKTLVLYDDEKLNPDGTFTPYLINTSDAIASGLVEPDEAFQPRAKTNDEQPPPLIQNNPSPQHKQKALRQIF